MSQAGYTPIQLYHSTTASAVPSAGNLANGEPALNITDGKLYYKNNSGVVTLLASASGASGDVVGPVSATDNALVRFDTTTGKLVQNSVGVLSDAGVLTGLTGLTSSGSITFSSLTSGRVPYATTAGLLTDSANLLFDGTTLTANALTVTNAVTLSGGTANGVAYLNGSKVLTTGSALTFDGSLLKTTGALSVQGVAFPASGAGAELFWDGSESVLQSYNRTSSAYVPLWLEGSYTRFGINGSEQMRLTSTGLGIGTSSPTERLQVNGNILAGAGGQIMTVSGAAQYGARTANSVLFLTNNSEVMRLDSSGNLGLGVTPRTSTGSYKAFEFGQSGYLAAVASGAGIQLASNSYVASGAINTYSTTGAATYYGQASGQHQWFTAPSGTAGNAISFTQAMTLDASGNLLVGTTSTFGFSEKARINGRLVVSDGSQAIGISSGAIFINGSTNNFTNGYYLNVDTSNNLTFVQRATSDTERARIDSSGNWCVGRAAQLNGTGATISTDGRGISCTLAIQAANSANCDPQIYFEAPGVNAGWVFFNRATSQLRCSVGGQSVGVSLANGGSSWGTFSDERLKDIVEPITNAAEKVATLRAVIGRYKTDDAEKRRAFLIAQDVQAVLPEAVYKNSDEDDTLSLAYTETIPLLVAAIQEQQALIQTLTARVAASP